MTTLKNDNGILSYDGRELGLRVDKPLLYGSLLLADDMAPECYFTFMFQVPRKIEVKGGFVSGRPNYYILDELSTKLADGFEEKLKTFRERYHIEFCLTESDDRIIRQILKSAGLKRYVISPEEAKTDNVNITLEKWFGAKNEKGEPAVIIDANCNLLLTGDERAKRAVRNLMVCFERLVRESIATGANFSEAAQRR